MARLRAGGSGVGIVPERPAQLVARPCVALGRLLTALGPRDTAAMAGGCPGCRACTRGADPSLHSWGEPHPFLSLQRLLPGPGTPQSYRPGPMGASCEPDSALRERPPRPRMADPPSIRSHSPHEVSMHPEKAMITRW